MVTAVMPVSKNDVGFLVTSLNSLYDQVDKIIIVSNDDINLSMNKVEVLKQEKDGIGNARVQGILYSEDEYIISADADTYYPPGYVESAVEALSKSSYAKPKRAFPWQNSIDAQLELLIYPYVNYEWALALRRSKFLEKKLDKYDYRGRYDIGTTLWLLGIPYTFNSYVVTRLPTYAFKKLEEGTKVASIGALGAVPAAVMLIPQTIINAVRPT